MKYGNRFEWSFLAILAILLAWALTSCGSAPASRGTQAAISAGAQARAESSATGAAAAGEEAAAKQAKATELERQAIATPTAELIRAAADARVDAAVANAVAAEKAKQSAQDALAAERAASKAAEENRRQAIADAELSRQNFAWWIAAGATAASVAAMGLLFALSAPPRWMIVPVCAMAGAWSLYAWAAWATWIAAIVAGLLLMALIVAAVWALRHVIRIEWPEAVGIIRKSDQSIADALDSASIARQAKPVKMVADWLLRKLP